MTGWQQTSRHQHGRQKTSKSISKVLKETKWEFFNQLNFTLREVQPDIQSGRPGGHHQAHCWCCRAEPLNLRGHQQPKEGSVKHRLLSPPRVVDSMDLGWDLKTCISKKFPENTYGLQTTHSEPRASSVHLGIKWTQEPMVGQEICLHSYHLARKEEKKHCKREKRYTMQTLRKTKSERYYTNLNKTDAATITIEILIQILSGSDNQEKRR